MPLRVYKEVHLAQHASRVCIREVYLAQHASRVYKGGIPSPACLPGCIRVVYDQHASLGVYRVVYDQHASLGVYIGCITWYMPP